MEEMKPFLGRGQAPSMTWMPVIPKTALAESEVTGYESIWWAALETKLKVIRALGRDNEQAVRTMDSIASTTSLLSPPTQTGFQG